MTETKDLENLGKIKTEVSSIPNEPRLQSIVNPLREQVSLEKYTSIIEHLSTYFTRFYTTETGEKSAVWIRDQFQSMINSLPSARRGLFSVRLFGHSFRQSSVIVTMKGKSDEIVVIGGHLDSTAGGATRRSPGADDDASGTAAVMEIFRIISNSNFVPDRTIEFMAYAAEEAGLLGSRDIAQNYKSSNKKVHSVLQLDMIGYNHDGRGTVGIITDSNNFFFLI
jgi:bacterial leucyl aminopeptidase